MLRSSHTSMAKTCFDVCNFKYIKYVLYYWFFCIEMQDNFFFVPHQLHNIFGSFQFIIPDLYFWKKTSL